MPTTRLLIGSVALVFAACQGTSDSTSVQDAPTGTFRSDMNMTEVLDKIRTEAQPGPQHERLAKLVGTWDVKLKLRPAPTAEWVEEDGTVTMRMALDGRYLIEELDAVIGGQPYKGYKVHGYDNLEDTYFTITMDSLATWPTVCRGQYDEDTKTLYLIGRLRDAFTPSGRPFRIERTFPDANTMHHKFYDTVDGEEVQIVDMVATRRS